MSRIRILHVIGSMNCGGAENLIMNLLRNKNNDNIVFDFLVHTNDKGFFDDEIISNGGRIYTINRFCGFNIISYYSQAKKFFQTHKEYRIVHGHIGSSAALYLHAAKECGCFTIAHSHSAGNGISSIHDLLYYCLSYPTRYIADYLFGCSTEAGINRYGNMAKNSKIYSNFHNAINTKRFEYNEGVRRIIRKQLNIDDCFVVGTVGRITEAKNPFFTIDLVKELVKKHPNIMFLWVGDGELESDVKEQISRNKLNEYFKLVGRQKNVEEYLMAMDIFVFPSKWEGLPTSVIEAQASGLKCVISANITKEVKVTSLVTMLSINHGVHEWVTTIEETHTEKRESPINEISESGYDITQQSKWLMDFYTDHYKEKEE